MLLITNVTLQGTPPFMAIALLLNGASETLHYAKYDLESIMYVTFYCATMLKGPNDSWRRTDELKAQSVPMQEWFDLRQLEGSYTQMGRTKASHMVFFERTIISKMDSYFTPLFSGFRELKEALFPNSDSLIDSPIDHKTMITIFNSILRNLPTEHTVATSMKRGTKRAVSSYASCSLKCMLMCIRYLISCLVYRFVAEPNSVIGPATADGFVYEHFRCSFTPMLLL